MKRIFVLLSLFMVQLADAQVLRSDALLLELSAWRARAGFHQLSINGNAPDDIQRLQQALREGATFAERLRASAAPSERETVGKLISQWQELSARAQDNPLATLGYADFNAFSELNTLVVEISEGARALAGTAEAGQHDELFSMGVRLQRLASEYLALTAFPSAGINTGTTQNPINFSSEAMLFEQELTTQERRYQSDPAMTRMLGQTRTRWSFIRNAVPELDDPDAAKVPLLFHRYSSQITADLVRLQH